MAYRGAGWTSDQQRQWRPVNERARRRCPRARRGPSRSAHRCRRSGRARATAWTRAAAKPRGCIGFWVIRRRCRSRRQHRWSAEPRCSRLPGSHGAPSPGQADAIEAALQAASCKSVDRWHAEDLIARCRELLGVLARAAKSGDTKNASRPDPGSGCSPTAFSRAGCSSSPTRWHWDSPTAQRSLPRPTREPPRVRLRSSRLRPARVWRRPAAGSDRVRDWHVTGSILGLDVALAPPASSGSRPGPRPAGQLSTTKIAGCSSKPSC